MADFQQKQDGTPKPALPKIPSPAPLPTAHTAASKPPESSGSPLDRLELRRQQELARQANTSKGAASSPAQAAQQLHDLIEAQTKREATQGTPATLLLGVENAADLRLGSTRKLVKDEGFWSGPRYSSLEGAQGLAPMLNQLRASGQLPAVLSAYQSRYGQSLYAVLGERIRDTNARERLLKLLPDPLSEPQLTHDAFLEQLAVGYSYLNDSASGLQDMTKEPRRGANPHDILTHFGYQAGAAIQGKWGFQMRVFTPVPGKAKWPGAIVAFRGTEGIQFKPRDPKSAEGSLDTLIGDLAPAQVGYNQINANADLIAVNMRAAAKYGPLTLTGHSLGGALAQIAATRFMAQTRQVVTFQSPAIAKADVDKVAKYNAAHGNQGVASRHYRIDGDVVPTSGDGDLPGSITYFDRVSKAKGSAGPYPPITLKADSLDLTRASSGHVTPMLSTYLRGRGAHDADQQTLVRSGLRDEATLDAKAPQDVGMVAAGNYTTANDPRINIEAKRQTTSVKAMRAAGLYQDVFEANIAYNTMLASVEQLAKDPQVSKTYAGFRTAAVKLLGGTSRLPMNEFDKQLGQQLKLPTTESDYRHPMMTGFGPPIYPLKDSAFVEMRDGGVEIPNAVRAQILLRLPTVWDSWHPESRP
ncbi:hypothetical protein EHF33_04920 [Deinococcus psychrotolerans]|uniref:Uncharacterized protein n=1 Tax=Deinococcus psychrotolerans TaxID=2489213 RepID=A0A3G8Y9X5_9DEIO|nr:thioesterase domain-containing protein [Deinococcus psychrotolerans]AZI42169.1 hypothetical protein EHF33_04920 [Deinococcus psychrotolerans]